NYVDKPGKTKAMVKEIMDSFYRNAPDGLIGNEDCGQMSAWYVLSEMGFYSVCPGSGNTWEPGQRLFESVKVTDDKGGSFTIPARDDEKMAVTFPSHIQDVPVDVSFVPVPFITDATKVFAGSQR